MERDFAFRDGRTVSRLGYGAMRLTGQPGNYGPYADWSSGVALLQKAVALGITHIDTARAYGPLDNERLIAEALSDRSDDVFIATKGGLEKTMTNGEMSVARAGSPEDLARHIRESDEALGALPIDLYYLHFPDPSVPIEASVEAMEVSRAAGQINRLGLSNVTLEQFQRAQTVAEISAVQNRFSLADGDNALGKELVAACADAGAAFIPHGPLGANPTKPGAALPIAEAMEWLLGLAPNVLLIPGTTTIAHLEENVAIFDRLTGGVA